MQDPPADRLRSASMLLVLGFVLALGVTLLIAFDVLLRTPAGASPAADLARTLGLSELSLIPSGRPGRHPGLAHPGVDLRHDPRIPPGGRP